MVSDKEPTWVRLWHAAKSVASGNALVRLSVPFCYITTRWLQVDGERCRAVVADDGIGLPQGEAMPVPGKLGALILHSLRENVTTDLDVGRCAGGRHAGDDHLSQ